MTYIPNELGIVSTVNSRSTPLTISQDWIGTYENVTDYASISIIGELDTDATLYAQFSTDGTNLASAVQLSDGTSGNLGTHCLIPISKFFRIRVLNSANTPTYTRVQTIYHTDSRVSMPSSRFAQSLSSYSDCLNTRAVTFGRYRNGEIYDQVGINAYQELAVDIPRNMNNNVLSSIEYPFANLTANYGIQETMYSILNATGTITIEDEQFVQNGGTSPFGVASVDSRRYINTTPGQTMIGRIGMKFPTPLTLELNSGPILRLAGVRNLETAIGVAQANAPNGFVHPILWTTLFGVVCLPNVKVAIYRLTFSGTPTVGTFSHTLVLDSQPLSANITMSAPLTTQHFAYRFYLAFVNQIAIPPYTWSCYNASQISGSGTVMFVRAAPTADLGTYSYTPGGGSGVTGAFTTVQKSVNSIPPDYFTPQSLFNIDTLDGSNSSSNPSGFNIVPTDYNDYQIELMPGINTTILYSVYDSTIKQYIPFHRIVKKLGNQTMRVTSINANFLAFANVTLYLGTSAYTGQTGSISINFQDGYGARIVPLNGAANPITYQEISDQIAASNALSPWITTQIFGAGSSLLLFTNTSVNSALISTPSSTFTGITGSAPTWSINTYATLTISSGTTTPFTGQTGNINIDLGDGLGAHVVPLTGAINPITTSEIATQIMAVQATEFNPSGWYLSRTNNVITFVNPISPPSAASVSYSAGITDGSPATTIVQSTETRQNNAIVYSNNLYGAVTQQPQILKNSRSITATRPSGSTSSVAFMLQNRLDFGNISSTKEIILRKFTGMTIVSNRTVTAQLILNPTVGTLPAGSFINWQYVDIDQSCMLQYTPTSTEVIPLTANTGRIIENITITPSGIEYNMDQQNNRLIPGDVLAVYIVPITTSTDVTVTLTWVEEN
jgi:hypothetical protein